MGHYECKYCGAYMCISECDEAKKAAPVEVREDQGSMKKDRTRHVRVVPDRRTEGPPQKVGRFWFVEVPSPPTHVEFEIRLRRRPIAKVAIGVIFGKIRAYDVKGREIYYDPEGDKAAFEKWLKANADEIASRERQ